MEYIPKLEQHLYTELECGEVQERHHNQMVYHIPPNTATLGTVFRVMEAARRPFSIKDYTLSQTTLDEVNQYIARETIKNVF